MLALIYVVCVYIYMRNDAASDGDGRSSHRACSCGFLELAGNMDDVDSGQNQIGQGEPLNRSLDGAFDEGMSAKRANLVFFSFENISRFNVGSLGICRKSERSCSLQTMTFC